MSRIKIALEKAKALRLNSEMMREILPDVDEPLKDTDSAVQYSTTKTVDVSREELLKNRVVAIDDSNPAVEQFKFLRTQVFQNTRDKGWNLIQITGFGPDEGKSMIAANLAVSIAKDDRQTALLVDLDLRRPSIHRLFGLERTTPGITSYLLEDLPIDDILLNTGIPKLTILPAGGSLVRAAEILGSPKMEALLKELKKRYRNRYIILDTPGINVCPDPLIISEYADAMILVARDGITSKTNIKAAIDRIPREKVLGIVFNGARINEMVGYGYSSAHYGADESQAELRPA